MKRSKVRYADLIAVVNALIQETGALPTTCQVAARIGETYGSVWKRLNRLVKAGWLLSEMRGAERVWYV